MAPIVFMVAEKPSLAESIAKLLGKGNVSSRKGFNNACSLHEWNGNFMGQHVRFKMTSVCGHVMTTNFHSQYNNWDKHDPLELFLAPIEKIEANPKLRMVEFLSKEASGASQLVLWLDCDREGENICFEVIDAVLSSMVPRAAIHRAHFTAVTDQEITHAINNLRVPNQNEALAVDARQELDLRIGCAFTRFQTKFFQGKYGDLNSRLLSFGPCQTPTLGFCVKRHDRIQSFKPQPFWRITASIQNKGDQVDLDWDRDRLFDKDAALLLLNSVKSSKTALILDVSKKMSTMPRPQGLNTVEMLRVASASLGIGPHQCMSIAERLYISGYINYPRTETTAYPPSMDLKGLLKMQTAHPEWGEVATDVLRTGLNPRKGTDAGDHPPIAPMRMVTYSALGSNDAASLYEYICRHFMASLMRDCSFEVTKVTLRIGEERFNVTSSTVIDPGFTRAMPWQWKQDTEIDPELLKKGATFPLASEPNLHEGKTSPPDLLSEADLITAMEKHGIGTDASIPVHIENIVERGYVELVGGRRLKPTALGLVLVHGYQAIDPELVLPYMRRAVEEQLNHIAIGKARYEEVVQYAIAIFSAKYRFFVEHIPLMDQLFEVSFSSLAQTGKPLSKCGKCHKYMKLVESKPQRLHCQFCSETYSLPQNGSVRNYKDAKCPLDDFELLVWSQGSKGKSFIFCPYCLCNPPFEGMRRGFGGCYQCLHPSCVHSAVSKAVDACIECEDGFLLLDDSTAPRFRFQCNRCDAIILLSDATKTKIEALPETFKGCVFCDENACELLTAVKAIASNFGPSSKPSGDSRGGRAGGRPPRRGRGRDPRN
ncbi:DNA topoisomerase 3-beta-1 [Cichlidogyrus casuarinus]|uniref:DNA topoisomerase n=1 Tax=Cichlidogyrus casuarinus TaxID=1844966 RepID=A0ABD2Q6Y9_9PLAT